ncbi:MAG: FtsQ-type POTRA domain-containing protein [Acidiferrobacterales bacterium]|nr:FtsQ-type POTRA domain-containing protein [Acidiferrobacterales bacterium]
MSPRALANQEREIQTQRLSKLGKSLLLLLATVLSFSAFSLLLADQLYRPQAFVIDELKIKGKFRYLNPEQVEQVIKQESIGNFFSVDLVKIKHNVESMAWVQSADIRREWPNALSILITEHRPIMPFSNLESSNEVPNGRYWLTSLGDVVDLPQDFDLANSISLSGNKRDSQLILKQTYHWKKSIEDYGLKLTQVMLSGSQAWSLNLSYLDNEFDLLLGRADVEQRLSRFLFLFNSQFTHNNQKLIRVDARYPNGLAIRSEAVAVDQNVAAVARQNTRLTTEQTTR